MSIKISFKKMVPEAKLPTQGKAGDAAYDLYCIEGFTLLAGQTLPIRTGLMLADMPTEQGDSKLHIEIKGRSGKAIEGIFPIGGVVDANYRGEIKVILHNGNAPVMKRPPVKYFALDNEPVQFNAGDRIAQFVVVKTAKDVQIAEAKEVSETNRGSSGFGSTGS
jgi:dUTP pyrophosphatase